MRRRFSSPGPFWPVPVFILLIGLAPLVALQIADEGRSLSQFPGSLEPGWIAWRPMSGCTVIVAYLAPCLLAWVAWKAQQLLVTPWPVLIGCIVLCPALVSGHLYLDRHGGEAIYDDHIVFRKPFPWAAPLVKPLSEVSLIETGCTFHRRVPSGIYNLVFNDGRRLSLGTSQTLSFGLSRDEFLKIIARVDALPALRRVERQTRMFGGRNVDEPGCLEALAAGRSSEDQAAIFRVFSGRDFITRPTKHDRP